MAIAVSREVDRAIGALSAVFLGFGVMIIREYLRRPHDRFQWAELIGLNKDTYHKRKYSIPRLPLFQHPGSCECNAIRFLVLAPKVVEAFDDSNADSKKKGRFPYLIIPTSCFDMTESSAISIYDSTATLCQHVFCKHCGVHLFHFDKFDPDYVAVNVFCLDDDTFDDLRVIFVPKGSRPMFGRVKTQKTLHATGREDRNRAMDDDDGQISFQKQLISWAQMKDNGSGCHTVSEDTQSITSASSNIQSLGHPSMLSSDEQRDLLSMKSQLELYLKRHLQKDDLHSDEAV